MTGALPRGGFTMCKVVTPLSLEPGQENPKPKRRDLNEGGGITTDGRAIDVTETINNIYAHYKGLAF